ncbi:MAG: amidohydrolase family protein [Pirellulales bacterium]
MILLGDLVLPDRVVKAGAVLVRAERIEAVGHRDEVISQAAAGADRIEHAGYIAPGYIDLHVHGGGGADFMDGTEEAFATALAAHLRHGTTSIVPTTTVARHEQTVAMLGLCRAFRNDSVSDARRHSVGNALRGVPEPPTRAATPTRPTERHRGRSLQALSRVLGAHLYGPHFRYEARGCHPAALYHEPLADEEAELLEYADVIATATIAPELPQAERFAHACRERGIRLNAGHSLATFAQMQAAVEWGVQHVDHLFCAMSDKTKLRAVRPYPMQGGVQEATLFFDELTTEVIADGKHLSADLLKLAYKIKGPDRLALVTDCSRALDMPEGEYLFGPIDGGEPFINRDGVGIMPDGKALASSVQGMDHMVRTFHALTGVPLHEVVRMATLTPARILGVDQDLGSFEVGKRADMLLLDRDLRVERVILDGEFV